MSDLLENGLIYPDWPAPANVQALMTTRQGGVSEAPFNALNLGDHVDDDPNAVAQNRTMVRQQCDLPAEPIWLTQVHGTRVLEHADAVNGDSADAIVTGETGRVCLVMTADCLPVLFCSKQGSTVAAAHAGWRGLEAGVLEATLDKLNCQPGDVLIWLGAAIGQDNFEVGEEVREAFVAKQAQAASAFTQKVSGKFQADLYALARMRLESAGVSPDDIYGGDWCTHAQDDLFFSYRRESRTGRMASMIWLTPHA